MTKTKFQQRRQLEAYDGLVAWSFHWRQHRRALGVLVTSCLTDLIVISQRTGGQFAAKEVIDSRREPRKFHWFHILRLAKFLFSLHELEWVFPVQVAPKKYVAYGDSDQKGSEF